jgi:hypothetical protein
MGGSAVWANAELTHGRPLWMGGLFTGTSRAE